MWYATGSQSLHRSLTWCSESRITCCCPRPEAGHHSPLHNAWVEYPVSQNMNTPFENWSLFNAHHINQLHVAPPWLGDARMHGLATYSNTLHDCIVYKMTVRGHDRDRPRKSQIAATYSASTQPGGRARCFAFATHAWARNFELHLGAWLVPAAGAGSGRRTAWAHTRTPHPHRV
jgi:hypothetical protein